jgi:hypothetical protein
MRHPVMMQAVLILNSPLHEFSILVGLQAWSAAGLLAILSESSVKVV